MGNIAFCLYNDKLDMFCFDYGNPILLNDQIQRAECSGVYMNGKRISWEHFCYIFTTNNKWKEVDNFKIEYKFDGLDKIEKAIFFDLIDNEEETKMTEKDYILKLEKELEESATERHMWMRRYEEEHERAVSLDKKYAELRGYNKGNEARDLINNIRHRLKIDDNEPDSYILDRLRSIMETEESYEKECVYWRKEATAVRGELALPYTADIEMVRSKIQDLKNLKKCEINVPYVPVDTLKLKRFKQELGDILGISKEDSYPEFVKAVKELKAANECQQKSIHDTLDSLIKLRKEKDDEERKLREMLIISNRGRDDAMATFDEVFDKVRDIWNLCCDGVCDDECDIDELLADIFEFCDRASTARNHLENERKLICDLYESVFGESAGSKASVILIGEIVRKLETWEKDKYDQIKRLSVDKNSILECLKEAYAYICSVTCTINNPYMLLYGIRDAWDTKRREYRLKIEDTAERARKAEKKLDDISKIIESSGRDNFKY